MWNKNTKHSRGGTFHQQTHRYQYVNKGNRQKNENIMIAFDIQDQGEKSPIGYKKHR